jgi:hypothetical protein
MANVMTSSQKTQSIPGYLLANGDELDAALALLNAGLEQRKTARSACPIVSSILQPAAVASTTRKSSGKKRALTKPSTSTNVNDFTTSQAHVDGTGILCGPFLPFLGDLVPGTPLPHIYIYISNPTHLFNPTAKKPCAESNMSSNTLLSQFEMLKCKVKILEVDDSHVIFYHSYNE